jgi:hypothetical protein
MSEMTDDEADYWDELFTKNPPKADPGRKGGYFTRQRELLDMLDRAAADYIVNRALQAQKLPAQIINDMVLEKIAASVGGTVTSAHPVRQ